MIGGSGNLSPLPEGLSRPFSHCRRGRPRYGRATTIWQRVGSVSPAAPVNGSRISSTWVTKSAAHLVVNSAGSDGGLTPRMYTAAVSAAREAKSSKFKGDSILRPFPQVASLA